MKRLICLVLVLTMLFSLSAVVLAAPPDRGPGDRHEQRHERNRHEPRHEQRHDQDRHYRPGDRDPGPLRWREHRRDFEGHHMRPIRDRNLERRYPGLHGYKWQGHGDSRRGFWHNDRYVNDGIVFFDNDDRMAGFGYMANNSFIFVDENGHHEDRDDLIFMMLLMKILESID
jgi:hypothetical protein